MTEGASLSRPRPGVALLRLERPDRLNALDDELFLEGLPSLVEEAEHDPEVRVLVITGQGRAFSAGADLDGCSSFNVEFDAAGAEDFTRRTCELPVRIRKLGTPTIAAVNGPAVGAGFGLAASCDFRFAAPQAYFVAPFILMGLAPDYGLSYFLPRLVGMQDAMDILLTGRRVTADEARALGLVWRLADDVVGEALAYAESLAAMPSRAVQVTRQALHASEYLDVETAVLVEEARAQGIAMTSEEFRQRLGPYRARLGR